MPDLNTVMIPMYKNILDMARQAEIQTGKPLKILLNIGGADMGDYLSSPTNPPPDNGAVQMYSQYLDRKSTRLNSSHIQKSRMPSSA